MDWICSGQITVDARRLGSTFPRIAGRICFDCYCNIRNGFLYLLYGGMNITDQLMLFLRERFDARGHLV